MYFSINRFTGDGVTTQWEFNFSGGYIDQSHVKVLVTDTLGNETLPSFTWVGPNTLSISPAVPAGATLEIYRDTPKNAPLVDYTDGAIVSEKNLDTSAEQGVFVAAEVFDRFLDTENLVVGAATSAVEAAELAASAASSAADDATIAQMSASNAAAAAAASQNALEGIEEDLSELVGGDFSSFLRAENNLSEVNPTIAKTNLGLGAVDNTSDLDKPISTAVFNALASLNKSSVGLGNVDNTSDLDKPVSTAVAQAVADVWNALGGFENTLATSAGSSYIGWSMGTAGAVARVVQDKLRESVSVVDFGADPTGVTDSTAAITAALATHKYVRFPAGAYKLSASVPVSNGHVLFGDGYHNTRVFRDTTGPAFDYFVGVTVTGVQFAGIHFDGVEKLPITVAANRYCAVRLWDGGTGNRSKDLSISHCKFTSFTSGEFQPEGARGVIAVDYCDDVVVFSSWFEDNRATCVLYARSKNVRLVNNYCIGEQTPYDLVFQPTQGVGSFCSGGSEGSLILGNRIKDTGYTSINCGGDGAVIANNVIYNASYSGITVNESSSNPTKDLILSGNSIRNTVLSGISIFNVDGFVLVGNSVVNGGTAGNGQIRLFPTSNGLAWPKNGLIVSNYLAGSGTPVVPGVRVNAGENITMSNNVLYNNTQGVFVQATNASAAISLDVVNNVFKDNSLYAVETSNAAAASQTLLLDRNTVLSTNISTKQATAFIINGASTTATLGVNTFSPAYNTDLVETSFANRATKAVLVLNSATLLRMKVLNTLNYINRVTYNPPSIASGSGVTTTVAVAGAAVGDAVLVSFSQPLLGLHLWGWVSGDGTVSVRFHNQTGSAVDVAEGTLVAQVLKI